MVFLFQVGKTMRSINYLDDASGLISALEDLDSGFGVIGASAV